jgi:hypothetical protein
VLKVQWGARAGVGVVWQHTFEPAGQKMSIDGKWVCSIADILCTPADKHDASLTSQSSRIHIRWVKHPLASKRP